MARAARAGGRAGGRTAARLARILHLLHSLPRRLLHFTGLACLVLLLPLLSCDAFKVKPPTAEEVADGQLKKLQVAVEAGIPDGGKAKVAVLAILDSSFIASEAAGAGAAPAKDKKKGAEDPAAPLDRERKVRDAVSASLVQNRLLELLQPDEASLASARTEMLKGNSAALSVESCSKLGTAMGADYIADAIVDETGKTVSLCVQRVSDGVVVYQDVVKDWPAVFGEAAPAAGAAPAK